MPDVSQLPNGRPQHMSAWCKEQLGWLKPTVIDPTVQQKLVLSPVEGSSRECFKVLVRPDGSEYYLLTNRHKTGFDSDLPGEGLLIWRVIGGRPFLVAAHGIKGPAASRSFLYEVPFPASPTIPLPPTRRLPAAPNWVAGCLSSSPISNAMPRVASALQLDINTFDEVNPFRE